MLALRETEQLAPRLGDVTTMASAVSGSTARINKG